ncbi:MAG: YtxH domain-containing protein [Clostridium sp.]
MGKVMKGLAVGAMVGAAIGIMAFPELDRKTQRSIRRTKKRMMGMAEDAYGNVIDYMK